MPRSRPHFKVHVSARTHPKTANVFGDNDLLAAYTRIGMLMVERYASKTDDTITVHKSEFGWITGRHRADVARKLLERLAEVSPMSFELDGEVARISLRNFSEKQGFRSKNVQEGSPSEHRAQNTEHIGESEEPEPPVPSPLSDSQVERLQALHPGLYTAHEVRCWYQHKLPAMKLRGITRYYRAAGSWFRNVNRAEIDLAVAWVEDRKIIEMKERLPAKAPVKGTDAEWAAMFEGGSE